MVVRLKSDFFIAAAAQYCAVAHERVKACYVFVIIIDICFIRIAILYIFT